jgi:hypothetical protein
MNIEYIRLPDNKGSDIEGLQRLYVTVVWLHYTTLHCTKSDRHSRL